MITTQLFIGRKPRKAIMRPVENIEFEKPRGGLWTSTYDPAIGSAWVDWCREEMPHWLSTGAWLIEPQPFTSIYRVRNRADLMALYNAYPRTILRGLIQSIDWERVAEHYDAVHFTHEGVMVNRWGVADPKLSAWDVESTLWMRWAFSSVAATTLPEVVA